MVRAYINGRIYSSFEPLRITGGMVVAGDRIIYVGDPDKAKGISRELGGDIIDLNKKVIVPGFIDSHMHMDGLGIYLSSLDLRDTSSIRELRVKLKEFIETRKPSVIIGRGWDQELFAEKRFPSRWDIDDITGDIPAILTRVCGHVALLNTAALETLFETGIPQDMHRFMQKNEKNESTGIIFEDLVYVAWERFSGLFENRKILLEATRHLAMHGVTSVGFVSAKIKHFRVLQGLEREGLLRTRVHLYFDAGEKDKVFDMNIERGFGTPLVKVNGIKFFADGSLGARTAYLSSDYNDDPGNQGIPLYSPEELGKLLAGVVEKGLQPAVHAIGDAAVDNVLLAMERSEAWRNGGRIEHASVLRPEQIKKISEKKIMVSVQPRFIVSDWWADSRLGRERLVWLYPFKSMYESGVIMGFSTDSPVEPLDPRLTISAAETRRGERNNVIYEATVEERLSRRIAFHLYTTGSARVLASDSIGVLKEGMYADFLVLDKDPLLVDDINKVGILETYVGGERVF